MSGRFVTFEGIEGSGKSTQLARVLAWLRDECRLEVQRAHEPGEGLGPDLRSLMLERARFQPWTMACLMAADRCEHVARTLRPALEQGRWVLCDRYTDSTLAYQGGGLGLPIDALRVLNAHATGGLVPDLTLVFDLDPSVGLARVRARTPGRQLDRFESAELDFHRRVRAAYLALRQEEPGRITVVAADAGEDAVFARVREALRPLLDAAA